MSSDKKLLLFLLKILLLLQDCKEEDRTSQHSPNPNIRRPVGASSDQLADDSDDCVDKIHSVVDVLKQPLLSCLSDSEEKSPPRRQNREQRKHKRKLVPPADVDSDSDAAVPTVPQIPPPPAPRPVARPKPPYSSSSSSSNNSSSSSDESGSTSRRMKPRLVAREKSIAKSPSVATKTKVTLSDSDSEGSDWRELEKVSSKRSKKPRDNSKNLPASKENCTVEKAIQPMTRKDKASVTAKRHLSKKDVVPRKSVTRTDRRSQKYKTAEECPTTTDSESDVELPVPKPVTPVKSPVKQVVTPHRRVKNRSSSRSSSSDSDDEVRKRVRHNSDSDRSQSGQRAPSVATSNKVESPPKLDTEDKAIQDKKKNDTLRKLFSNTVKREQEGGKGGAKGGAKGGGKVGAKGGAKGGPAYGAKGGGKGVGAKGKGGSKGPGVIIVGSESDRTFPTVDEGIMSPIPSPRLASPVPVVEILPKEETKKMKQEDIAKPPPPPVEVSPEKAKRRSRKEGCSSKSVKQVSEVSLVVCGKKTGSEMQITSPKYREGNITSLMCRILLTKLSYIPSKQRSGGEDVRIKTELADTRQSSTSVKVEPETKEQIHSRLFDEPLPSGSDLGCRKRTRSVTDYQEEGDTVIPKCDIVDSKSTLSSVNSVCDKQMDRQSKKHRKRGQSREERSKKDADMKEPPISR